MDSTVSCEYGFWWLLVVPSRCVSFSCFGFSKSMDSYLWYFLYSSWTIYYSLDEGLDLFMLVLSTPSEKLPAGWAGPPLQVTKEPSEGCMKYFLLLSEWYLCGIVFLEIGVYPISVFETPPFPLMSTLSSKRSWSDSHLGTVSSSSPYIPSETSEILMFCC